MYRRNKWIKTLNANGGRRRGREYFLRQTPGRPDGNCGIVRKQQLTTGVYCDLRRPKRQCCANTYALGWNPVFSPRLQCAKRTRKHNRTVIVWPCRSAVHLTEIRLASLRVRRPSRSSCTVVDYRRHRHPVSRTRLRESRLHYLRTRSLASNASTTVFEYRVRTVW